MNVNVNVNSMSFGEGEVAGLHCKKPTDAVRRRGLQQAILPRHCCLAAVLD